MHGARGKKVSTRLRDECACAREHKSIAVAATDRRPTIKNDWQQLGGVTPTALAEARINLHYAAQIVSGVGRTWAPKRDDDSHTNLGWRSDLGGLVSRSAQQQPALSAGLDFSGLQLLLLDDGNRTVAERSLADTTLDHGYRWLQRELAQRWGSETGDVAPLHYDMPDHELGRGAVFRRETPEAFAELARWFGNASTVLERVREEHGSSPVRCWPHHFDLATLISLGDDRSIGVGLTPGDESCAEPYFYVGPWPHPTPARWPELAAGSWHTDGFVAAVLTGSELVAALNQAKALDAFLDSAIEASRTLLQKS